MEQDGLFGPQFQRGQGRPAYRASEVKNGLGVAAFGASGFHFFGVGKFGIRGCRLDVRIEIGPRTVSLQLLQEIGASTELEAVTGAITAEDGRGGGVVAELDVGGGGDEDGGRTGELLFELRAAAHGFAIDHGHLKGLDAEHAPVGSEHGFDEALLGDGFGTPFLVIVLAKPGEFDGVFGCEQDGVIGGEAVFEGVAG